VFFKHFAVAEPLANVYIAHGTSGPALASARHNAKPRRRAPVSSGGMTSFCSVNLGTTFLWRCLYSAK